MGDIFGDVVLVVSRSFFDRHPFLSEDIFGKRARACASRDVYAARRFSGDLPDRSRAFFSGGLVDVVGRRVSRGIFVSD